MDLCYRGEPLTQTSQLGRAAPFSPTPIEHCLPGSPAAIQSPAKPMRGCRLLPGTETRHPPHRGTGTVVAQEAGLAHRPLPAQCSEFPRTRREREGALERLGEHQAVGP